MTPRAWSPRQSTHTTSSMASGWWERRKWHRATSARKRPPLPAFLALGGGWPSELVTVPAALGTWGAPTSSLATTPQTYCDWPSSNSSARKLGTIPCAEPGWCPTPSAQLGMVLYGNEFSTDTGGVVAGMGPGLEFQVSRTTLVGGSHRVSAHSASWLDRYRWTTPRRPLPRIRSHPLRRSGADGGGQVAPSPLVAVCCLTRRA